MFEQVYPRAVANQTLTQEAKQTLRKVFLRITSHESSEVMRPPSLG